MQQNQRAVAVDGAVGERCRRRELCVELEELMEEMVRRETGVVGERDVVKGGSDGEGGGGEEMMTEG